jgi:hypothetical protein
MAMSGARPRRLRPSGIVKRHHTHYRWLAHKERMG